MGGTPYDISGGEVWLDTLMTQIRQLNGEFEFEEAYHADPRLGIAFTLCAFLVLPILLMNLLIAIMFEAHGAGACLSSAHSDRARPRPERRAARSQVRVGQELRGRAVLLPPARRVLGASASSARARLRGVVPRGS